MTLPWIKEREERLGLARASLEIDTTLASSPSAGDIQKAGRTFRDAHDDLIAQRDVLIELLVAKIDPRDNKERRDFVLECLSTGMVPMKAPKTGQNLDEEDIKELVHLRNEHIRLSWHLPITPHSSGLLGRRRLASEEGKAMTNGGAWCCSLWKDAILANAKTRAQYPKGLRLQDSIVDGKRVMVPLYSTGKEPDMLVTHCPFCGKKMPEAPT